MIGYGYSISNKLSIRTHRKLFNTKRKKKKKKHVSHINYPSFHINNKPYTLHD